MRQWFARPSTAQRSGYEGLIPGVKSPARARPVAIPRRRDASLPGTRRNLRRSQTRSSQPTSGHGLVTASRAFSASRCSSWRVRDGQRARKQDECGSGSFAIRACRGKAETHELARLRTGFDKHHVLFDGTAREGNALPVRRPGKAVDFRPLKMRDLFARAAVKGKGPEIADPAAVIERGKAPSVGHPADDCHGIQSGWNIAGVARGAARSGNKRAFDGPGLRIHKGGQNAGSVGRINRLADKQLIGKRDRRSSAQLHLVERSEEHTSELQSRFDLVCRLLLEKKKISSSHTSSSCNDASAPAICRPTLLSSPPAASWTRGGGLAGIAAAASGWPTAAPRAASSS